MYPSGELDDLAARKELLRVRIAIRRMQCSVAAAELVRPLELIDGLHARWQAISPLVRVAGVPLFLVLAKKFLSRGGKAKWLMIFRSLPVVMRAAQAFARTRASA